MKAPLTFCPGAVGRIQGWLTVISPAAVVEAVVVAGGLLVVVDSELLQAERPMVIVSTIAGIKARRNGFILGFRCH